MNTTEAKDLVAKASKVLCCVLRTCKDLKKISTMKMLYVAYVHSSLEYASHVWSPRYISHPESIRKGNIVFYDTLIFGAIVPI